MILMLPTMCVFSGLIFSKPFCGSTPDRRAYQIPRRCIKPIFSPDHRSETVKWLLQTQLADFPRCFGHALLDANQAFSLLALVRLFLRGTKGDVICFRWAAFVRTPPLHQGGTKDSSAEWISEEGIRNWEGGIQGCYSLRSN